MFQTYAVIGTVFIKHFRILGNGVYGSTAGNGADIVGGYAVAILGNFYRVKRSYQTRKHVDCVAVPETAETVSAFGGNRYFVTVTAHGSADYSLHRTVVQRNKLSDSAGESFRDLSRAFQVAQPLFAAVRHDHETVFAEFVIILKIACADHQYCKIGSVVGHPGRIDIAVFFFITHRFSVGKHRIRMRHNYSYIIVGSHIQRYDYIECFINDYIGKAVFFEPVSAILCA